MPKAFAAIRAIRIAWAAEMPLAARGQIVWNSASNCGDDFEMAAWQNSPKSQRLGSA
jgi:hypothetical protein